MTDKKRLNEDEWQDRLDAMSKEERMIEADAMLAGDMGLSMENFDKGQEKCLLCGHSKQAQFETDWLVGVVSVEDIVESIEGKIDEKDVLVHMERHPRVRSRRRDRAKYNVDRRNVLEIEPRQVGKVQGFKEMMGIDVKEDKKQDKVSVGDIFQEGELERIIEEEDEAVVHDPKTRLIMIVRTCKMGKRLFISIPKAFREMVEPMRGKDLMMTLKVVREEAEVKRTAVVDVAVEPEEESFGGKKVLEVLDDDGGPL